MLPFQAELFKDIASTSPIRGQKKFSRQVTIRFDERQLLLLRDLGISPASLMRQCVQQTLLALKADLSVPHPDERTWELQDETGRYGTFRDFWFLGVDEETQLPIYKPDCPLGPGSAADIARAKAEIAARDEAARLAAAAAHAEWVAS